MFSRGPAAPSSPSSRAQEHDNALLAKAAKEFLEEEAQEMAESENRRQVLIHRENWLMDVTEFMKARTLMNQKWISISQGVLETYDKWDHLSSSNSQIELCQPANSLGDLYMIAEKIKPVFDNMFKDLVDFLSINREADKILSKGLVESFPALKSAPVNDDNWISNDHLSSPCEWGWDWLPLDLESIKFPFAVYMPLKDRARVLHKAKENYADQKFPMIKMMDIIRASIVCISDDHIRWTINHIISRFNVLRVDNRFKNLANGNGYRDVIVRVGIPVSFSRPITPAATAGGSSDVGGTPVEPLFICEIQVHLLPLYVLSANSSMNLWSNYTKFRVFFGPSEKWKSVSDRLKVMKKMDQVGDDFDCLEDLMQVYLQKTGRVSRDIVRIGMFVDLFMKVREDELAEELQFSVVRQLRDMGKSKQLDLSAALGKLAAYFILIKKYDEAEPLSREALSICIDIHGQNHKETSLRLIQLGRLYYCQKLYDQGLPFFLDAVNVLKFLEGTDANADIIKLYVIVGELYSDMNRFKDARAIYLRIIEVTKIVHGTDINEDVADMYSRLAFFDEVEMNCNDALKNYNISLDINIKCFDECSDQVATNYNALGYVYYTMGFRATALIHFEKENKIRSRLPICKKRGECLNLIGHMYLELQLFDTAEPFLKQGHDTYLEMQNSAKCFDRDALPEQFYLGFASSKNDLAEILLRKGPKLFDVVKDLLNVAYTWRYRYLGINNAATKKTLLLQDILFEMVKTEALRVETHAKHEEFMKDQAIKAAEDKAKKLLAAAVAAAADNNNYNNAFSGGSEQPSNRLRSDTAGTEGEYQVLTIGDEEKAKEVEDEEEILLPEDTRAMRPIDPVLNALNTILNDAEEARDEGNWLKAIYLYRKTIQTFYFYKKSKINGTSSNFNIDNPNPQPTFNHIIEGLYDDKKREWLFPYLPPAQSDFDYEWELAVMPKTAEELMEEEKKLEAEAKLDAKKATRGRGRSSSDATLDVKPRKSKYDKPKPLEVEIIRYNIDRDLAACIVFLSFAVYMEDTQNYEEGIRIAKIVLKNLYEIYGYSIPQNILAQTLLNLGSMLMKSGRYNEALETLDKAKSMYTLLKHDPLSAEFSTLYHNIGLCLHSLGDLIGADRYLTMTSELRLKLYGPDDASYRASLNSLALLYITQGDYDKSYGVLKELLDYKLNSVGNSHPSYTVTLNNFAAVHYLFSDLAKAGKLFTDSLEFREKLLRKGTKLMDDAVKNMCTIFEVQNDSKNSGPFQNGRSVIQKYMSLHPHLDK